MLRTAIVWLTLAASGTEALAQSALDSQVELVMPKVIEWRRHLHQNPELTYQEEQTAAYIFATLRTMPGLELTTGLAKNGVKAVLRGGRQGPVIALRADMDALPVEEKNDLPFRSRSTATWQGKQTGVMHACGHDAHAAMLLGAAQILARMRASLAGTIVFLFQPAEESGTLSPPSGAYTMVAAGALADPKVEAIFGQHILPSTPAGSLLFRRGATMASSDAFYITVRGAGGHGGMPWLSKDPIVTLAQIITNLQTIVSRQADLSAGAAVITVGQISGGNRVNIIPEEARLGGTIRTLNEASRKQINDAVRRMASKTAEASGLTAEVSFDPGYPVLVNDEALTSRMLVALELAAGPGRVRETPPLLASEDFGAYSTQARSFFWFLNAPPQSDRPGPPNHSPLFLIGERHMKVGVSALVHVSLEYLRSMPQ